MPNYMILVKPAPNKVLSAKCSDKSQVLRWPSSELLSYSRCHLVLEDCTDREGVHLQRFKKNVLGAKVDVDSAGSEAAGG